MRRLSYGRKAARGEKGDSARVLQREKRMPGFITRCSPKAALTRSSGTSAMKMTRGVVGLSFAGEACLAPTKDGKVFRCDWTFLTVWARFGVMPKRAFSTGCIPQPALGDFSLSREKWERLPQNYPPENAAHLPNPSCCPA